MTDPDETTDKPATEARRGTPNADGPEGAAGGMGSSSEWVGPTGPGQVGADGLRDTSVVQAPDDVPPEQDEGGDEPQPEGIVPKAGYPSLDPRSKDKLYQP
ncbi:hypothetical protein [Nocardioides okcheonensis]|uniref:hypothetical protein n=1 Tax=Nocardioides okcheonensis TaxID=2894081 RepID=UPI001E3388CA|nr:hypothetical protein [Nocardioides okcheonensis]UFN42893.1 hypothetical protein LN652_12560 [Nocardioides okcheonensis]